MARVYSKGNLSKADRIGGSVLSDGLVSPEEVRD